MYYIIGKISTRAIVEYGPRPNDINFEKFIQAIAANNECIPADLSVMSLNDKNPIIARIKAGDEWVAVWTGNAITDIDFSAYDLKDKIRFNSDKTEIIANSVDTCKITVRLISAVDADVAQDVSGVYIPVQSPLGIVTKKVNITAGVARFDFWTATPGLWMFPVNGTRTILNYRVKNPVTINALLV